MQSFAKRLHEDVHSYTANGFCGIIQDGSQRSFFPNGLSYYVYAATLFDNNAVFDEIVEDYLRHAYGDMWQIALDYLKVIDMHMPQTYLEAKHSRHRKADKFYNPEMELTLLSVNDITKKYEEKFAAYRNMPYRVQTVSVRLLTKHMEFCRGLADALALKCVGKDLEAKEQFETFMDHFGSYEVAIERYYDHMMAFHGLREIFNSISTYEQ